MPLGRGPHRPGYRPPDPRGRWGLLWAAVLLLAGGLVWGAIVLLAVGEEMGWWPPPRYAPPSCEEVRPGKWVCTGPSR